MRVPDKPEIIGKPLRRKEDQRLLKGMGRYSDDLNLPRHAYAAIVRSPYAHAVIRSIDNSEAMKMPGVLCVGRSQGGARAFLEERQPVGVKMARTGKISHE